ncbi:MAG: hypothetical protein ACYS3N_23860 [Planctomycetota bacterium]|jgi:hypothetical protein
MSKDEWVLQIVTVKIEDKEYTEQVTIAGLERWLATYQHRDHFLYKLNQAFYDKLTKREDKKDGGDSKAVSKSKKRA